MLFLPNDDKLAALAKQIVEDVVKAEGRCHIVGWRDVPVVKEVVGPLAKATEPRIVQVQSQTFLSICDASSILDASYANRIYRSRIYWCAKAGMVSVLGSAL